MSFDELFDRLPHNHNIIIYEKDSTAIFKKSHALTCSRSFEYSEWFKEINEQVREFFYFINSRDCGELHIYLDGSNYKFKF